MDDELFLMPYWPADPSLGVFWALGRSHRKPFQWGVTVDLLLPAGWAVICCG